LARPIDQPAVTDGVIESPDRFVIGRRQLRAILRTTQNGQKLVSQHDEKSSLTRVGTRRNRAKSTPVQRRGIVPGFQVGETGENTQLLGESAC
jgi:hypothetical protein